MYQNTVPKFHGRYLSSNVNITVNNVSVPVGERFAKFKTSKGRKVTALGVLFDFTGNDKNTTVQKVENMVNETWVRWYTAFLCMDRAFTATSVPQRHQRRAGLLPACWANSRCGYLVR